jgi:hypothetical protein
MENLFKIEDDEVPESPESAPESVNGSFTENTPSPSITSVRREIIDCLTLSQPTPPPPFPFPSLFAFILFLYIF